MSYLRREITALERYQRALDLAASGQRLAFDSTCGPEAETYIRKIRNPGKREYAREYWRWMNRLGYGKEPQRPAGLSVMGAQAVRHELRDICNVVEAPDESDLVWMRAQAEAERE